MAQWKKKDNPNEAHDVAEIARFTEKDMEKAIEEEGIDDESINSDSENEVAKKVKASGINHGDLFNVDRGKARYNKGDVEFEEEMGGASQMVYVATNMMAENFESDTGDEDAIVDDDESAQSAKANDALKPIEEDASLRPSPVKSSSICLGESMEEINHSRNSTASATSEKGTPPVTQPPAEATTLHQKPESTKQNARSKVSIMGVVFEESKTSKDKKNQKKSHGLYIPSYSRSKK